MQPTLYDITYYEGDSFTLNVYPKDSTQAPLDLTGVEEEDCYFRIADKRGDDSTYREYGTGVKVQDDNGVLYIECFLDSNVGDDLKDGYVYDIGYWSGTNREHRTTLVTGTFRVMSEVKPK